MLRRVQARVRDPEQRPAAPGWRRGLYVVIFEHDTRGGRAFDVALLVAILGSVAAVMLESVTPIRREHGPLLRAIEWGFTALFSIEYLLRIVAVRRPARYARSFFGLVDLLAVLPTYLSVLLPGAQSLITIRALRLLRAFRILKLVEFLREAWVLSAALRGSARKIIVFLGAVLTLVVIFGSIMYVVEGGENGFTSIPRSVYWAIVTLTTVGYGNIVPETMVGEAIASAIMILGYSVIAVPTGIMSVELAQATRRSARRTCDTCGASDHDSDAAHCKRCGSRLPTPNEEEQSREPT